jgi:prolipoprotein diacylglyceryltransferase
MRLILTFFSTLVGVLVGAFIAYLIFGWIYPVYASHHPLDASAECSRANGLAYLSILIGASFGGILSPVLVWRHY